MGYDFTGGRIFDFCIDFSMGLTTVQRYCAACDALVIRYVSIFINHLAHALVIPIRKQYVSINRKLT